MQRRDLITIKKIITEMNIGIDLLGDTELEDFLGDEKLKRALGMTCINVGELVKVVTDETREKNKDFPWKAVAGLRDITAHRYQTLRMEDVYITVSVEYPELLQKLKDILSEEEDN
jgi:uncharacterized protein with HEPN domain